MAADRGRFSGSLSVIQALVELMERRSRRSWCGYLKSNTFIVKAPSGTGSWLLADSTRSGRQSGQTLGNYRTFSTAGLAARGWNTFIPLQGPGHAERNLPSDRVLSPGGFSLSLTRGARASTGRSNGFHSLRVLARRLPRHKRVATSGRSPVEPRSGQCAGCYGKPFKLACSAGYSLHRHAVLAARVEPSSRCCYTSAPLSVQITGVGFTSAGIQPGVREELLPGQSTSAPGGMSSTAGKDDIHTQRVPQRASQRQGAILFIEHHAPRQVGPPSPLQRFLLPAFGFIRRFLKTQNTQDWMYSFISVPPLPAYIR
ncbi:unnamed protein product [Pleuronectes platessa]|uniref:Uncharacterized protein n=1 Tax=Pleuronectes platessa TaxID=8262 RepID=A0A9N7TX34_PLEPL|nr:unnamed protein product [Pleuronectes platessa]